MYFNVLKVSEDRNYMKRKEANAFEEQLLKQKMDELHKKLHQVVELSHKDLPASENRPDVCPCSSLCPLFPILLAIVFLCFVFIAILKI